MTESIFERPLTIDEVKKVRAFYIEMRSTMLNTYFSDCLKVVHCVDDEAVHTICKYKPYYEIAEFDNYNIGWRAWISYVSDETRKAHPWDEVKKCKGVGYDWDYNIIY